MSQVAPPVADVSTGGWTPTPVFQQINGLTYNDSRAVSSGIDPAGDTFEVRLKGLAWPAAGPETLTVRLKQTGGGNVPVTVTLFQWTRAIATRTTQPPAGYSNYTVQLTQGEIDSITNYSALSVRVTAGLPVVSCCPGGLPATLHCTVTDLDPQNACACMAGTYALVWDGVNGRWRYEGAVCGCTLEVVLRCAGPSCDWWWLDFDWVGIGGGGSFLPDAGCTCSPLNLAYTSGPLPPGNCCLGRPRFTVTT